MQQSHFNGNTQQNNGYQSNNAFGNKRNGPSSPGYQNSIQQETMKKNKSKQNAYYPKQGQAEGAPQGDFKDQNQHRQRQSSENNQFKRGVQQNNFKLNSPLNNVGQRPMQLGRNYQRINYPIQNFRAPVFIQPAKPKNGVRPIIIQRPNFVPLGRPGPDFSPNRPPLPGPGFQFNGPPPLGIGFNPHGGHGPQGAHGPPLPHRGPPNRVPDSNIVSGNPFATGDRLEFENDLSGEGPPGVPQIDANSLDEYDQYDDFQGLSEFSGPESSGDGMDFDYPEEGNDDDYQEAYDRPGKESSYEKHGQYSDEGGERKNVGDKLVVDPYAANMDDGNQDGFDYGNDEKYQKEDSFQGRYPSRQREYSKKHQYRDRDSYPEVSGYQEDMAVNHNAKNKVQQEGYPRKQDETMKDKKPDILSDYGDYEPKEPVVANEMAEPQPGFDDLSEEEKKFFASKLTEDEKSFFSSGVSEDEKRYFKPGGINEEAKAFFTKFGGESTERGGTDYDEYEGFSEYGDAYEEYGGEGGGGSGASNFFDKKGVAQITTNDSMKDGKKSKNMKPKAMKSIQKMMERAKKNNWKPVSRNLIG